jgi:hypothetical protein
MRIKSSDRNNNPTVVIIPLFSQKASSFDKYYPLKEKKLHLIAGKCID